MSEEKERPSGLSTEELEAIREVLSEVKFTKQLRARMRMYTQWVLSCSTAIGALVLLKDYFKAALILVAGTL